MIHDQLAEYMADPKLRLKLLMLLDNLLLSKAVEMSFQLESAAQQALQLMTSDLPLSHCSAQLPDPTFPMTSLG